MPRGDPETWRGASTTVMAPSSFAPLLVFRRSNRRQGNVYGPGFETYAPLAARFSTAEKLTDEATAPIHSTLLMAVQNGEAIAA